MRPHTKKHWTADDDARMRAEFPHVRTLDLARALGRSLDSVRTRAVVLGLQKTPEARARIDAERAASASNAGRFQRGASPWNKGKTDYRLSHGAPLGTERLRDGYRQRKVVMDGPHWRRWRFVHVLVWEDAHGPVPKGFKVMFRDGNPEHITIENLELISHAKNLARNSAHAFGPELFKCIQLRGAITRQLNKRKAKA
jgi:hypothetical protein